jgi:ribosomal subunit interface protein
MSELRIRVTGRNIDVGDALRSTIVQNLQNGVARYSNSRDGGAIVTLSKERHLYVVEIILHLDSRANFEAKAGAPDPHAAFAQALDKIEKRARRHKRKATDHHSVTPLKAMSAE